MQRSPQNCFWVKHGPKCLETLYTALCFENNQSDANLWGIFQHLENIILVRFCESKNHGGTIVLLQLTKRFTSSSAVISHKEGQTVFYPLRNMRWKLKKKKGEKMPCVISYGSYLLGSVIFTAFVYWISCLLLNISKRKSPFEIR